MSFGDPTSDSSRRARFINRRGQTRTTTEANVENIYVASLQDESSWGLDLYRSRERRRRKGGDGRCGGI